MHLGLEHSTWLQQSEERVNARDEIVVLLDCDNTLLDNDAVEQSLSDHLTAAFGPTGRQRYWKIFERIREESGYADYLGALQCFRLYEPRNTRLLRTSSFLLDFPFAGQLYPGALAAIRHLRTWGPTVILSDGDVVFQPHKIRRSGLWDAVEGRVLVYVHKENRLAAVAERYPAHHYVLIDDKLRILAAAKERWGTWVTTIQPRQGHYALEAGNNAGLGGADLTVDGIGDLVGLTPDDLPGATSPAPLERSLPL